ncbi:hypothetical protein E4U13_004615 [Claviceps humidiphila]|uniref:Uncharacterized protein n=1 Tax=Claviceps humidiphila TaxID=1294629 RepID=A0A9P7PZC7_9HYPO|nr:hypothetical protein E4U13_004615 [Claviceps humidiphila]
MPDPSHLVAQQVDDQIRGFQAGWIAAIEAVGRPSSGIGGQKRTLVDQRLKSVRKPQSTGSWPDEYGDNVARVEVGKDECRHAGYKPERSCPWEQLDQTLRRGSGLTNNKNQ